MNAAEYLAYQQALWGIPKAYRQARLAAIPRKTVPALKDAIAEAKAGRLPDVSLAGAPDLDTILATLVNEMIIAVITARPGILTAELPTNNRVLWVDWPILAAEIRRIGGNARWSDDLQERVSWQEQVPFLILAGIGEEVPRADRAEEALQALLSLRHNAGRRTLWTSALTAQAVIARYPRARFNPDKIVEVS